MKQAREEDVFLIDGQKSALHCLFWQNDKAGVCAPPHYHKYCEILCGIDCDVNILTADGSEKLCSGDVCFLYPNEPHYLYSHKEKNTYYVIKFFPEILFYDGQGAKELSYLARVPGDGKNHSHVVKCEQKDAAIDAAIRDIFEEWNEKKTGYEFAIRGQILRLYSFLFRVFLQTDPTLLDEAQDENASHIRDAALYITEHLDSVTEDELAKRCYMSPSRFSKAFSAHIGKSYQKFLTEARLAQAKRLLIATDQSVTEIAFSVGFSSSSHFISVFRAQMGMTPRKYKARFLKK